MFSLEFDSIYTINGAKIIKNSETGELGIKCLDCDKTSWDLNDVSKGYCPNCNAYHNIESIKLDFNVFKKDLKQIESITSYSLSDLFKK